MNKFTADYSSSTASTPITKEPQRRRNIFSNTPALASTTPLAPPPSQVFGSSQLGTGVSKLQFARDSAPTPPSRSYFSQPRNNAQPSSRLFQYSTNTDDSYAEEDQQDYTDDMMEAEWEDEAAPQQSTCGHPGFLSVNPKVAGLSAPSLLKFSTNSTRQSHTRSMNKRPTRASKSSQLPSKGRDDVVPSLARDLCRRAKPATLEESDEIIIATEQSLRQLEEEAQNAQDDRSLQLIVAGCAQELVPRWQGRSKYIRRSEEQTTIGPLPGATSFEKARYLASLLLQLYHPQNRTQNDSPNLALSQHRTSSAEIESKPVPETLLEWLDIHHTNYDDLYDQVISTEPNCASHDLFWDVAGSLTLRGKLGEVMQLLADADFHYARFETPSGSGSSEYTGRQLQAIQAAVFRARQTLNACPALQIGDWRIDGQDWGVYRKQVEAALDDLVELADDHDDDDDDDDDASGSQRLPSLSLFGQSNRKSSKGLPFEVFQRVRTIYSILLGNVPEIMTLTQDWLEASMALTIWWNGSAESKVAQWSFDVSRANNTQNVDEGTVSLYLTRLKESFLFVTDPDSQTSFQINTMSPVEVGLGAVLQGDIQAVVSILQTLSLCVTSAIAEIGTWAGWIASSTSLEGLNEEDLMVLTYGAGNSTIKKDDILEKYAQAIFEKKELRTPDGIVVEGWEMAFSLISRLDEQEVMQSAISDFLERLQVTDKERAEKLVTLCEELGLQEESRKVSETFGDHLVGSSEEYGTALLCYARSHSEHKVRQLLDLLNSYCLVQSKAYPPNEEMDDGLERLVSNPKAALSSIAEVDPQAAEALQFYLVGYACLRKFYSLRDEDATKGEQKTSLRPLARRKAAARALIAAINSAADSIYGGLYDPERQSAIQVDGLLTLLGEATAFLAKNSEKHVLTSDQMYALLAAVEDLQTGSDRVYRAAEECLEAALRNYHGSLPPSPHAMLKKSMSSGTNSNFSFSMMGSEMLARSEESVGGKSLGSAVLVGKADKDTVERGWDWRSQFKDPSTTGADVLRYLRIGIAKELSVASFEDSVTA